MRRSISPPPAAARRWPVSRAYRSSTGTATPAPRPGGPRFLASTALCPVQAFRLGAEALALQFHVEADPDRIETWLIGHAFELAKAGVDPQTIRADAGRRGAATAEAGRALLSDWLAALPR